MASTSEVKQGLDDIAAAIRGARAVLVKAVANAQVASDDLGLLPTTYAGVIATIGAYVPTGEFETLADDELAKLTTEFTALKVIADAISGTSV